MKTFEPKSAKEIDEDITVYADLANRVQGMETVTPCHFLVAQSNGLKQSILDHIAEWQNGFKEVLKTNAYARIKSKLNIFVFIKIQYLFEF